MRAKGHTPIIAVPKKSPLLERVKAEGIRAYTLEDRWYSSRHNFRLLKQLFNNEKPDIVNVHTLNIAKPAFSAADEADSPIKIFTHHYGIPDADILFKKIVKKKGADFIFTNAEPTTQFLRNKSNNWKKKVFTIPSFADPPPGKENRQHERTRTSEATGFPPEDKWFGIIGNISRDLDLLNLIDLLRKNNSLIRNICLYFGVSGKKKDLNSLESFLKRHIPENRYCVVEMKEVPHKLICSLDGVIIPARQKKGVLMERINQTLISALQLSCPVIILHIPELETITRINEMGLVSGASDAQGILKIIEEIIKNKNVTQARTPTELERANHNFTFDKSLHEVLKLYRLFEIQTRYPKFMNR